MIEGDKVITDKRHYDSLYSKIIYLENEINKNVFRINISSYRGNYINLEYNIGDNFPDKEQIELLAIITRLKEDVDKLNKGLDEKRKIQDEMKYTENRLKFMNLSSYNELERLPKWVKWWYNIKIKEE